MAGFFIPFGLMSYYWSGELDCDIYRKKRKIGLYHPVIWFLDRIKNPLQIWKRI